MICTLVEFQNLNQSNVLLHNSHTLRGVGSTTLIPWLSSSSIVITTLEGETLTSGDVDKSARVKFSFPSVMLSLIMPIETTKLESSEVSH